MPIRFLSDQSIDNQLTIQGAANGNPLLKLYSSTGDGAIAQFSDQSSLSQTGDLRYVHIDLLSYGSGNAFIFESNQSTLSVLADGKLLFKEGLFIKPSSGTGGGTQLISSAGAYKIPSIVNAGTDTDQFLVRDSSGNVDFRTGAEVRSDIGAGTGSGTVTSVGVSVGTGLDVSGSPITSSGTITISLDLTEITLGAGLDSSATGLSLDLSEFTDMTQNMVGSDEFIVLDSGAERRKAASEIGLSIFNNDAGFVTSSGVTSVATGTGLTGGTITTTGTISLATAGAGSGTYGSTANTTKIDTITLDAYGRVTAVTTGSTGGGNGTVTSVATGDGLSGGTITTSGTLTVDSTVVRTSGAQSIAGTKTFTTRLNVINGSNTSPEIGLFTEINTAQIADSFSGNTNKSYIYLAAGPSSNDPGYILHETSATETNEGVLHLVPSDDNSTGDYVSIHGTNDPDILKLHTSGLIETVNLQLQLKSGLNSIYLNDDVDIQGDLGVSGGGIILGGTGRIQGVDTVSSGTDAANKTYVDNQISGVPQGTVTSVAVSGGTGISISGSPITSSGTITVTNTSPDQTVALTGGTGISVSGTYPNFTITNTSPSSGGTMSSWNLQGDSGGSTSITNGETVDIAGGTNISTSRSSNTITITNGITNNNQLTNGAGYITSASIPSVGNGTITMVAGTGLTGGGTFTTNQSGNTSITFNASGSGTMSNWNLTADSGGTAQIDNGETVDIVGGTNITTARSGNNVTINNGITNNNQLTNGAGYTTNTGDITAVVAGAGLTGGSTSGSATLNLDIDGTNNYIEMNNDVTPASGDFVPFSDISTNVVRKTTFSDIPLSILNNDIGFGSGTVTSVATGNGISGGTITTSGTLTVGAGNGLSQSSTGLLMSGSYSGSFTVNGSTLSLTNSGGYAALEVGGTSGAFLDLKKPASDDYDIRLIHTTAGSNELTTASGALNINTGNSAAMQISTSEVNLSGGKLKLESITSIDMQSSALKIGDVSGSDEVEQIDLITMANSNIVLQDQIIKLQSDDVQFNSTSSQDVIYGSNVKNVLPGDMSGSGFQGDVLKTITQSVSSGLLYYKTTTGWALADADSSTTTYLLAIATGSNASSGMLLRGFFYKASHGFTIGRPLYVGTSAGNLQQSAPVGTNDYARVVGYPTSSDTIYFNPDNTWVRVS